MNTKTLLLCLTAWFCTAVWGYDAAALAQTPTCNLDVGCHWEITIGTSGTYTQLVLKIGPDATNLQSFPFSIATTQIADNQAGLQRKVSGVVVAIDGTIKAFANDGTLLQSVPIHAETGGTPVPQAMQWQVCATSPSQADVCTDLMALTVL